MQTFVLEIGTEEIPAGYINPALSQLEATLTQKLSEARIGYGRVRTMGTPRRLSIIIDEMAFRQEPKVTETLGPPVKIALDDKGEYTQAALKFAEKVGATVADLSVVVNEKGEYVAAQVEEETLETIDFLAKELPELILKLAFPKKMRWGNGLIEFARPIQSLVALFGSEVVNFALEDLKSQNHTFGHRFLAPEPIRLNHALEYEEKLEEAYVTPDIAKRREMLVAAITEAVKMTGGEILEDYELVDLVVNLVEMPYVVVGSFDSSFLEIPDEVLITSMREHQKYFSVVDKNDGKLLPHFVVVSNMHAADMAVVAKGNERVLRARLEDAKFFFNADREVKLETRVQALDKVLFQAKLGSMLAKVKRIEALCGWFGSQITYVDKEQDNIIRAARLCKADLVSGMVVEFPKLQGVMGRVYALNDGENIACATAIEEHYMPTYSGGELPASRIGGLLAIADKMDTICGCFSVGLIPTGAADPYALRRQSIGILQIIRKFNFNLKLRDLVVQSLQAFQCDNAETVAKVMDFLQARFQRLLEEEGYAKDVIAAVLGAGFNYVTDAELRVKALDKFKGKHYFEALAATFKRVVNILRKAEIKDVLPVNAALLKDEAEQALWEAVSEVKTTVETLLQKQKYEEALLAIAKIRAVVDGFFDDVMVMAEDEALRNNRLALLSQVGGLFRNIADFAKIQID